MFCDKCGHELKQGTRYCTQCGSRAKEASGIEVDNPTPQATAAPEATISSNDASGMTRQDVIIIVSLLVFAALLILIFAVTL